MARKEDKKGSSELRVAELFAGVGGFRVGLERASKKYKTVWFNQWEPGKSDASQHAWRVYCQAFGEDVEQSKKSGTNTDIHQVPVKDIPDHDLLVGGFPCQDYSVARVLSHAAGLVGKKGVLWWDIYRIISEKGKKAPRYLMLENVDRLPKSPVSQRGRDFAIMLATLAEQGYAVEWRVINAADYGMPQRRRRIYILGYKKGTSEFAQLKEDPRKWLTKTGIMPKVFPTLPIEADQSLVEFVLGDPKDLTDNFNKGGKESPFQNAGVMVGGKVYTVRTAPFYEGERITLGDVVEKKEVAPEFYISKSLEPAWRKLKDGKKEERTSKTGFTYAYSEGPVAFPDPLNKPSRTIITGEGGPSPSRFKHVIETRKGLRRLTPLELERLNMFPDNHTAGASDNTRAFFMGNALVVGIVERLGKELAKRASNG